MAYCSSVLERRVSGSVLTSRLCGVRERSTRSVQLHSPVLATAPSVYFQKLDLSLLRLAIGQARDTQTTQYNHTMPTDLVDGNGGSLTKPQAPPSSPHSSEGSPSSLIVARGRSRVRRISSDADPFSEENLRKRYVSGRLHFFCRAIR